MSAKLIVVFKDSLMGSPVGLQYKIYANGNEIDNSIVSPGKGLLIYDLITNGSKVVILSHGQKKEIHSASQYKINVFAITGDSRKEIGSALLLDGKKITVIIVSPWTRVPINLGMTGDDFQGDFFDIEYEKRESSTIQLGTRNTVITSVKIAIKDIPRKIIITALKYRGSSQWSGAAKKTCYHPILNEAYHFSEYTNKCSAFVSDVLLEAGLNLPWIETGYARYTPQWLYQKLRPPLAEEWANPELLKENWDYFNAPMPGDIGAYVKKEVGATGHVGIIIAQGVTISANSEIIIVNDAGFRNKNGTARVSHHYMELDFIAFRRYRKDG